MYCDLYGLTFQFGGVAHQVTYAIWVPSGNGPAGLLHTVCRESPQRQVAANVRLHVVIAERLMFALGPLREGASKSARG